MRNRAIENGMSLFGGVLLGAAAMYLLDPETGRRRRQYIREMTGEALSGTGDVLGATLERAREVGSHLSEKAREYGHGVADATESSTSAISSLGGRIGELGQSVIDRARGIGRNVGR